MEALHGKCPMDGVGGTMKRVVFDSVKSNSPSTLQKNLKERH